MCSGNAASVERSLEGASKELKKLKLKRRISRWVIGPSPLFQGGRYAVKVVKGAALVLVSQVGCFPLKPYAINLEG